jgi:hypothetical protein
MERASEKAYISKKDLKAYQIERAKLLKKKQGIPEDAVLDEEEEAKKVATLSSRKDHHITSHFDLSTLKLTSSKTLLDSHTMRTLLSPLGLIDGIIEKDNHKSVYVMFRYRDSALKA